jgi:hypothetical protein
MFPLQHVARYSGMAVGICGLSLLALPAKAQLSYTPIDISTHYNVRLQDLQPSSAGIPTGNVIFGGIPFVTDVSGSNAWWGQNTPGGNGFIDISVNLFGVQEVQTLINSSYGRSGPAVYTYLEFFGTNGAYYRKDLIGNVDIRDHYQAAWTNSINGTTTTNVYSSGPTNQSRVDKQGIVLPANFGMETLTSIRLHDTGSVLVQNTLLYGVTVGSAAQQIPEPGTLSLLALVGLMGVSQMRRRRA